MEKYQKKGTGIVLEVDFEGSGRVTIIDRRTGGKSTLVVKKNVKPSPKEPKIPPESIGNLRPLLAEVFSEDFGLERGLETISQLGVDQRLEPRQSTRETWTTVCAGLAAKGISAERVAKALIEGSDLDTRHKTGEISDEKYDLHLARLTLTLSEKYYPGAQGNRKRKLKR